MRTERLRKQTERGAREARLRAIEIGGRLRTRATDLGHEVGDRTKDTRRRVGYWIAGEKPRRQTPMIVLAGVAGAAAAFFLDPVSGKRRRHVARDWVTARVRGLGRRTGRAGRAAGAHAYGTWQSVTHRDEAGWPENDQTLAHKVESEALRGPDLPGTRVNVNAEHGVVVLRGAVERPEQIREIEERVRRVHGVLDVHNLLHAPGTPAPTG